MEGPFHFANPLSRGMTRPADLSLLSANPAPSLLCKFDKFIASHTTGQTLPIGKIGQGDKGSEARKAGVNVVSGDR
jgi:hypothetical protein